MSYREVCLVGDSIAQGFVDETGQGWFSRLGQKLAVKQPCGFGLHNASQSGDSSVDALHRLSAEAVQRFGDYLILAVGTNDVLRWRNPDAQMTIAPDLSEVTWQKMLRLGVKCFQGVLVCACLPCVEARYPQPGINDIPVYRFNRDVRAYNEMLGRCCTEAGVPMLSVYDAFDGRDELYFDGSHPNAAGHEIIADAVLARGLELGWF